MSNLKNFIDSERFKGYYVFYVWLENPIGKNVCSEYWYKRPSGDEEAELLLPRGTSLRQTPSFEPSHMKIGHEAPHMRKWKKRKANVL
jgi:hypothetical protein